MHHGPARVRAPHPGRQELGGDVCELRDRRLQRRLRVGVAERLERLCGHRDRYRRRCRRAHRYLGAAAQQRLWPVRPGPEGAGESARRQLDEVLGALRGGHGPARGGRGARSGEQRDDVGDAVRRRQPRALVLPLQGLEQHRDLHRGEQRAREHVDADRGAVQGVGRRWSGAAHQRPDPGGMGRGRRLHAKHEPPTPAAVGRRRRHERLRRRDHRDAVKHSGNGAECADGCLRCGRQCLGGALLDGAALRRRQPDHELPDHAVHRHDRADRRSPPGRTATTRTVTGLTNGTAYTFKVAATNAVGTGADSTASPAITPTAAQTAPGAPTAVSRHGG